MKIFPHSSKKKHSITYFVVGVFILAVELILGINAALMLLAGVVLPADRILAGTPWEVFIPIINAIASLVLGIGFTLWGVWTFSQFINTYEDAAAYEDKYGVWLWPRALVWGGLLLIWGIDFTALLFRRQYFADKGAAWLFWFFVLMIFIPWCMGCLMHVLENTPRDRRLALARQRAVDYETQDLETVVEEMDPDLRSRWLNGDSTAIEAHYDRKQARAQEEAAMRQRQEDERRAQAAERRRKKAERNRPLASASLPQQAQGNGSRPQ